MIPNTKPQTKYINNKYHIFLDVHIFIIDVQEVSTKEKLADIFIKVLDQNQWQYLRRKLMGR